jgi:hypothetical protein
MTGWWAQFEAGMKLLAGALTAKGVKRAPGFGPGPMTEDEARYIKALLLAPDQFASERVRDHWAAVRKELDSGVGWNESLRVAGEQFGLAKKTVQEDYIRIEQILPRRMRRERTYKRRQK